jgi:hypothetical protein
VAVSLCVPTIAEAKWQLALDNTADTGATEDLVLAYVDTPYADLEAALTSGRAADLLQALRYQRIGFKLDLNVAGAVAPNTITADDDYPNAFTVQFAGKPFETDVFAMALADRDGTNGIGPLLFLGTGVRQWSESGNTVALPNSDLNAYSSPREVRRMAVLLSTYLDPADPDRTVKPGPDLTSAVSAIFVRDNGRGDAPVGPEGGRVNLSADFGLGGFLDVASADYTSPDGFSWDNVTNAGNVPMFSRHELRLVTKNHLPVLSCGKDNDIREKAQVEWIVYRPFDTSCAGGRECFTLPTLPASFPNASSAPQKRPGFDQRVGSGLACGTCALANERCVDPDGSTGPLGAMCMGGAGTPDDPYFTQAYEWLMHVYDLELAPSFDFNEFEFAERRLYMTHESSNRINMN